MQASCKVMSIWINATIQNAQISSTHAALASYWLFLKRMIGRSLPFVVNNALIPTKRCKRLWQTRSKDECHGIVMGQHLNSTLLQ